MGNAQIPAKVSAVSLEEYLSTSYHPDREYVHGELVGRLQCFLEHWQIDFALAWKRHLPARTAHYITVEFAKLRDGGAIPLQVSRT